MNVVEGRGIVSEEIRIAFENVDDAGEFVIGRGADRAEVNVSPNVGA